MSQPLKHSRLGKLSFALMCAVPVLLGISVVLKNTGTITGGYLGKIYFGVEMAVLLGSVILSIFDLTRKDRRKILPLIALIVSGLILVVGITLVILVSLPDNYPG